MKDEVLEESGFVIDKWKIILLIQLIFSMWLFIYGFQFILTPLVKAFGYAPADITDAAGEVLFSTATQQGFLGRAIGQVLLFIVFPIVAFKVLFKDYISKQWADFKESFAGGKAGKTIVKILGIFVLMFVFSIAANMISASILSVSYGDKLKELKDAVDAISDTGSEAYKTAMKAYRDFLTPANQVQVVSAFNNSGFVTSILIGSVMVIGAPLFEELVFRFGIEDFFVNKLKVKATWVWVIVSGLAFGLGHVVPYAIVDGSKEYLFSMNYILPGISFGIAYLLFKRNLCYAILLHAMVNGTGLLMLIINK